MFPPLACPQTLNPPPRRRPLAWFLKAVRPGRAIAAVAVGLFCLMPVRGYGYDFYNDWPFYDTPIGTAPATHSLDASCYQSTTWFDAVLVWIHASSPSPVLKLKVGGLPEVVHDNGWEVAVEVYGLYKTANGDWWAEQVLIYRDYDSILLENQNLGRTPLTVTTAAPGASEVTLNSEIREPYHEYSPPVVTLAANGVSTAGGQPKTVQASAGSSLTFTLSATDADGNCERTRLWVRAGENGDWQEIYNSTAPSGSCPYTLGALAGHYWFKSRALDDTEAESMSAIIHVEAVAPANPPQPVSSLDITAATANGQVSATRGGNLTIYLGESVVISSTATAPGRLSEHNIHGYTPGPSPFAIPGGVATLPALPDTATSARTVTWTPDSAGTYTLYAEAFTGSSPGERIHGVSGWPGYAGGPFGGLEEKRITVNVRRNPAGSLQVLDVARNPVASDNGVFSIGLGDVFLPKAQRQRSGRRRRPVLFAPRASERNSI